MGQWVEKIFQRKLSRKMKGKPTGRNILILMFQTKEKKREKKEEENRIK